MDGACPFTRYVVTAVPPNGAPTIIDTTRFVNGVASSLGNGTWEFELLMPPSPKTGGDIDTL